MSSPSTSRVSSVVESIDSASPVCQAGEPWLPRSEELPNSPWYEEKSSTLRLSDIDIIKEKGGTMGKFEVPIPRFIAAFCRHIQLSPSQLDPNSYSFLLALAVLLSYHDIPLIPYVLMQLVQVKRLGPGKFYLSHKGDHSFIKGNPSSYKGWMSRFFYIKSDVMRDPWRCEMHWRDSAITIVPRTPDRAPSLTPFLEAMCDKSYNAPELIKEDLLCFFKFSRKGAELVGDLDDRMGKAELVKAMQEAVVAPPKKTTNKRKASSAAEKEARGDKRKKAGTSTSGFRTEEASQKKLAPTPPTSLSEEALDVPPVTATVGAPSSGKGPEQPPPFDPYKDSLVEYPCPVAATRYICNMAPDRDVRVLRKARNADVVGHFSSNLAAAVAWGGEMVKRLTKAHKKMNASRDQFDKAMGQHGEVLAHLEELETLRSREEGAAKAQREALEAQAELEEVKARAMREAERLKLEGKEEFLKSPEFDTLLGKKAGGYFKNGLFGCVAQWRANGYPEEEHPASFLNVQQAIAEMADEEEEEDEDEEGNEGGDGFDATTPSSPLS
ncbi:hypothetical protein F511_17488 [Dorcoceras hygrometricum]|uniref:Uncharacterized protein n=1 Tax=Dorcoceras hygrometricum TaxID=472368 RepID=A0A2Z7AI42_9LAMI|nr:hypothetical protein F511_17488 [Dorcoceras hygrometricum]